MIDSRTIAPAHQYWQERVDVDHFLGREQELAQLQQWIVQKRCRVVAIWGMGGLGKTTLAVKLVEEIQAQFEYVIWRSLREAPLFEEQIAGLLQCLDSTGVSERLAASAKLAYLMEILRSHRCLMVFNQFETVLAPNQRAGVYREGYQGYGELLRRLAQEHHLSCCLLTTREKPDEVALFEGNNTQVRSLFLDGLTSKIAQQLLTPQNLIGSETEKQFFVSFCANNPLVIRMASLAIQNLFNNNLTKFLATKPLLLYDIRQLLEQQFSRLSSQEKQMMYALAVSQRLTQLQGSKKELTLDFSLQEQLETLESLQKRSLIQPNSVNLAQPSLLKTYILEKLVEEVEAETYNQDIGLIVKDLLRETLLVTEQQASREFKKYG